MDFTDHDVVVGSTDDGHTFVLINANLPGAQRIMEDARFTPHEHRGRIVYLLSPEDLGDRAFKRTGEAMDWLFEMTMDVVDLAWTARENPIPADAVDVRFKVSGDTATAHTSSLKAQPILALAGFVADGGTHRLPAGLQQRDALTRIASADAHLSTEGITSRIQLGIKSPADLPPVPGH